RRAARRERRGDGALQPVRDRIEPRLVFDAPDGDFTELLKLRLRYGHAPPRALSVATVMPSAAGEDGGYTGPDEWTRDPDSCGAGFLPLPPLARARSTAAPGTGRRRRRDRVPTRRQSFVSPAT